MDYELRKVGRLILKEGRKKERGEFGGIFDRWESY